jgi:hypothetical protein
MTDYGPGVFDFGQCADHERPAPDSSISLELGYWRLRKMRWRILEAVIAAVRVR